MTRHSKNCTASSVYSYHEKRNDTRASGFGTLKERFGKDGIKDFDCCCISLHPCRQPVVTQDGYLYEKEAILEYVVAKKAEYAKQMKEYEKQCNKEKSELEELGAAEERSQREKFFETEASVSSASQAAIAGSSKRMKTSNDGSSVSNMVSGREKKLPSFWVPSLTPHSKDSKIVKPDKKVFCPMSGKPLKMKDLIEVKFTLIDDSLTHNKLEGKHERYKCPVTGDILRNNISCAILKPSGDVVTLECVEKLIKKDMIHPLTGTKLDDKDIIVLQRGGTGYASVNDHLVNEKARPVMQA